jgi:alkanesulfonate monooxygenase SsuD/methylene tetrahydromethanopterin reductase-like flavin-dependent oxidoreductase (luciferase family)
MTTDKHTTENDAAERRIFTRYERSPEQKQTVAQMVEWCEEHGLDPAEVRVAGGFSFMWEAQETDEEVARRVEHERAADERHREWLRRRVREVFGHVIPHKAENDAPDFDARKVADQVRERLEAIGEWTDDDGVQLQMRDGRVERVIPPGKGDA